MFPWESKALGYLPGFGDALPEKLQETGCTVGSLDREIFLPKTKRKFRLLFLQIPTYYAICCFSFPSWTWEILKNDLLLERTQVDCFYICRNSNYHQLKISSLFSSSWAFHVPKYLLSFTPERWDLHAWGWFDIGRSPKRTQNATWKSTSMLSKLYYFGLLCDLLISLELLQFIGQTMQTYYPSASNTLWLSHVEDHKKERETNTFVYVRL